MSRDAGMRRAEPQPGSGSLTRREFVAGALAGVSLAGWPAGLKAAAAGQAAEPPLLAPPERLNIACIGIGNRGNELIKPLAASGLVNFVALCDVDLDGAHTDEVRKLLPKVPCHRDFREMFRAEGARFEAVVIATPDHSHFPITMHALRQRKHVYLEKPLAQTFREAELLMAAAAKAGVVTQMGNQGHSGNNYFQFKSWFEAGIIRDVTRIDAHMNSPRRWHGWQIRGYPPGEPVPPGMDWDLWHVGRAVRPFSSKYHPQNWRGWYAYGNGAFGDWGPHILDTAHRFLRLGLPHTIEAVHREGAGHHIFPQASTIRFDFAARGPMPPVEVFWYDGVNNPPPLPKELGPEGKLPGPNGKFIYSREHVFRGGTHGDTLRIIPEEKMRKLAPGLPKPESGFSDHLTNFILACRGREEARSPFHISGPLSQVFLLGVIAQRLGGKLEFDTAKRRFNGSRAANKLLDGESPRRAWRDYYRA